MNIQYVSQCRGLKKVNTANGAPMGRPSSRGLNLNKLTACIVPLVDGGYDKGGAYWGFGVTLWRVRDNKGNHVFIRAATRNSLEFQISDMFGIKEF